MTGARLVVWDDDACWRVHEATLALLEETGVEVRNAKARARLQEAGARLDGERVRIPAELVDAALQSAPRRFSLTCRDGGAPLTIANGTSYFGTGADCLYVRDLATGRRRRAVTSDIEAMASLCQRLPDIDFVMSMWVPDDVAPGAGDVASFAAMLTGTAKPLIATPDNGASLARMRELAELCGSADSFACYAMSKPPLIHSADAIERLTACAEWGVPLVYHPAPSAGASAPASIAAVVTVANAEVLSGLVLHQLVRRGAPFIYGVGAGVTDMRTGVDVYSAPEHFLGNAAACDLARFYDLPTFAYAAVADSKILDEQYAAEAGITTVLGALSRATLLHDVGYLESGLQASYETIVLGSELVSYARALLREVGVSNGALALAEISRVGPGATHLGTDYTRAHHREFWSPSLFDRGSYERWRARGATTLRERVRAQTEALMAMPRTYALEDSVRERVQALARSAVTIKEAPRE